MSELINFTISMAQNFYNIQNRHLLEAIFLALHSIEELFIAHADVFWIHNTGSFSCWGTSPPSSGGKGDGLAPAGDEDDLPC